MLSHLVPAAQVSVFPPLQLIVHAAPPASPPHWSEQSAVPSQFMVQPPCGHAISHLLVPVHVKVEPAPRFTLQSLPPPHETVLLVPVVNVQSLVPLHVEVQFAVHVDTQVDCA